MLGNLVPLSNIQVLIALPLTDVGLAADSRPHMEISGRQAINRMVEANKAVVRRPSHSGAYDQLQTHHAEMRILITECLVVSTLAVCVLT
jgi:hypothetical protein